MLREGSQPQSGAAREEKEAGGGRCSGSVGEGFGRMMLMRKQWVRNEEQRDWTLETLLFLKGKRLGTLTSRKMLYFKN